VGVRGRECEREKERERAFFDVNKIIESKKSE